MLKKSPFMENGHSLNRFLFFCHFPVTLCMKKFGYNFTKQETQRSRGCGLIFGIKLHSLGLLSIGDLWKKAKKNKRDLN